MQRTKGELVATVLVMLFCAQIAAGLLLKRYEESYHRPSYYNRAHSSSRHVDYNRQQMDERDMTTLPSRTTTEVFNAAVHLSYYVHILYKASVFCVGTLITRRMVITSSRCFLAHEVEPSGQYKAKHMSVLMGNDFGQSPRQVWPVIAFFMPASTEDNNDVHDVVLLALKQKLEPAEYRSITLFKKMPASGEKVQIAFMDVYSQDIKLSNSTVVPMQRCKRSYEKIGKIAIPFNDKFICVKNKKSGGCSTRPGDPLIIDNKLAGVNIYGEHCDELEGNDIVDVYYAIRPTIPHIQQATDLLRAFTSTGPFNSSITTRRTQLYPDTSSTTIETTTV